jgi:tetratricopeptide (TPR) repeat protein
MAFLTAGGESRAAQTTRRKTDSMIPLRRMALAAAVLLLAGQPAAAQQAPPGQAIADLAAGWARATYDTRGRAVQEAEAQKLEADAAALAQAYPGRAEPIAWEGLMLLVQADAAHSLRSLSLIGQARKLLEQARAIDPNALGPGVIDANLGALYAQAPGRPLSFGDKGRARRCFDEAIAAGPHELETNYLYGDFLLQSGDAKGAAAALERAVLAPPRPSRRAADVARKAEARRLLAKARAAEG